MHAIDSGISIIRLDAIGTLQVIDFWMKQSHASVNGGDTKNVLAICQASSLYYRYDDSESITSHLA